LVQEHGTEWGWTYFGGRKKKKESGVIVQEKDFFVGVTWPETLTQGRTFASVGTTMVSRVGLKLSNRNERAEHFYWILQHG
jgi:hypothetical protein